MRCVYINLDSGQARRAALEARFAAVAPAGVELARFPAHGGAEAAALPGELALAEKGCFSSHRAVVAAYREGAEPLMVLEDDAVFCAATFEVARHLHAEPTWWDLLFTDIGLYDPRALLGFASDAERLRAKGAFQLVDVSGQAFFSASAYVVAPAAKPKLHALLAEASSLDVPYDLYLRQAANAGRLRIAAVLPFLTSVSDAAHASQIQGQAHPLFDRTAVTFRQLLYVDRDEAAVEAACARLLADCDGHARRFGAVMAGLMASNTHPR